MKKYFTELINTNLFFLALVAFVLVLPLSVAMVSVFGALLLLVALVEDKWRLKWERLKKRKVILLIPLIFFIYLLSTFVTLEQDRSFYDVKKTLFYLIIPLAFSLGKEINSQQKRFVFYAFSVSILTAVIIALFRWKFVKFEGEYFSVHNISLVSHIRFSFQLILIVWFFILLLISNFNKLSAKVKLLLFTLIAIFISYLLFQQSLTGLLAFSSSWLIFGLYKIPRVSRTQKVILTAVVFLLIAIPVFYVNKVVNDFYDFEQVNPDTIDKTTVLGNPYNHNFESKLVENGHFVYLYFCKQELKEEWNKVSELKYDSTGVNGYLVSSTLIRYLTSKGLRKDAEGVHSLTQTDIANIEKGIANVVYTKRYSLYPRIYQTVWEYYIYSETGNSNNQSFSQRIEFAKAAITIIRDNWLTGVGTGGWKTAFAKAFEQNKAKLDKSHYASSHNQYLNYMVKFGIPGFLLILFLLIYPVVKTRRYRDSLFMIFLVFMFIANFADSNLESHMGSSFFFFFYCLFLTGPKDYLSLNNSSK